MRKKILALMMAILTAIMMIGCNKTGLSLLGEMQKMYDWEAIESKVDFTVEATAGDEGAKLYGDITSYMNMMSKAMEGVITFRKAESNGETIDLTRGKEKIAPIKIIYKDGKTYVNKSYIDSLLKLIGTEPSRAWKKVASEYIGIEDKTTDISKETMNKYIDLMKKVNTDFNITQDNRSYTVEMTDSQLVEVMDEFMGQLFKSDFLKKNMLAVGEITEKEYADFQKEVEDQMDKMLPQIKSVLKGSNAKAQYIFTNENCKESGEVNFVINGEENKVDIKLMMTGESKKAVAKEIEDPVKTKVYSMEEFNKLLVPNRAYIYENELVIKINTVYVPLRETMEQLNIPITYDSKNKTASVTIDDKQIEVKTKMINNVAYVTKEQIIELGLTYSNNDTGFVTIEQLVQ